MIQQGHNIINNLSVRLKQIIMDSLNTETNYHGQLELSSVTLSGVLWCFQGGTKGCRLEGHGIDEGLLEIILEF